MEREVVYKSIETEILADAVKIIRLAHPPVNALNLELLEELHAATQDIAKDQSVRAVVLMGTEKAFCAGADISQFKPVNSTTGKEVANRIRPVFDALAALPQPTIAAITGYALGGGLELALACDFRVAEASAMLGLAEIQLGIIPGGGGTQRLPRLIGSSRAKDLIFSGRRIKAEEALAWGLVDRLSERGSAHDDALEWAAQLATGPTLAITAAKRAIDTGLDGRLEDGLSLEGEAFAGTLDTQDAALGVDSFLNQGPGKAQFLGR